MESNTLSVKNFKGRLLGNHSFLDMDQSVSRGTFNMVIRGWFPFFHLGWYVFLFHLSICFFVSFSCGVDPGTISLSSIDLRSSNTASSYTTFPFLVLTLSTADNNSWFLLRFSGIFFIATINITISTEWVD